MTPRLHQPTMEMQMLGSSLFCLVGSHQSSTWCRVGFAVTSVSRAVPETCSLPERGAAPLTQWSLQLQGDMCIRIVCVHGFSRIGQVLLVLLVVAVPVITAWVWTLSSVCGISVCWQGNLSHERPLPQATTCFNEVTTTTMQSVTISANRTNNCVMCLPIKL